MTYGERIRQGREAKGLTQEELAEAVGVSRQAVSKWEGDLSRAAAGENFFDTPRNVLSAFSSVS